MNRHQRFEALGAVRETVWSSDGVLEERFVTPWWPVETVWWCDTYGRCSDGEGDACVPHGLAEDPHDSHEFCDWREAETVYRELDR